MWFLWLGIICGRHHALLRQACMAVLGALCLSGCVSWQTLNQQPGELLARHPHSRVRAVLHDGGQLTLYGPFIRSDSLGGVTDTSRHSAPPVLVALKDIRQVQIEQVDAGRTVLAVAAIGGSMALVVGAVNAMADALKPPPPPTSSMNLKFSCPLVYSWDGRHWRLDSGTFGGAITEGLQRTDLDNLDYARAEGGVLRLRVANELAETDHLDALAVLAVDHDSSVTIAPDPDGTFHTIGALVPPVRATDDRGVDALPRVIAADGWNWESTVSGRDPSHPADLRSGLELAFIRPVGASQAHLVVDANSSPWGTYMLEEFIRAHGSATQAWYDSMDARPALARRIQARLGREAFLAVSVRTAAGWEDQGLLWEAGPEIVKRQVVDLDLSRVVGDTVLVRLTSAPSFWTIDRVALDFTADREVAVHELTLVSARDRNGVDVAPLIAAVDHRDYALRNGASAEVVFAEPPLPRGQARTYLLRSTGWYRVDTPQTGEPNFAALAGLGSDSLAVGRASVLQLNAAITRLAANAR